MGKKEKKQEAQVFELFVSGLPYTTTEDQLKQFFNSDSISSIKLPKYQDSGRCLGYAHIQFSSKEQFQASLKKNGQTLGNRYLDISIAKGAKKPENTNSVIPVGCKVLFVKNLPYEIQQDEIKQQFSSCGIVEDVRMVRNWYNKNFKGFAYIDFRDLGSVKKAINKYNGKNFRGRILKLDGVTTGQRKGFKKRDEIKEEEYAEQ